MTPPTASDTEVLIVEDDEGHALLIRENLEAAGLETPTRHFRDGGAALDFLLGRGPGPHAVPGGRYVALLDIRMPRMDGAEVLARMKADPSLRRLPVIILTTTEDSREVERCHALGCSGYLQKPVEYGQFAETIRRLGLYLRLLHVPRMAAD